MAGGREGERPGKQDVVFLMHVTVQVRLKFRQTSQQRAVSIAGVGVGRESVREPPQSRRDLSGGFVFGLHLTDRTGEVVTA